MQCVKVSHFQNKDTWAAFVEKLKRIVQPIREKVKAEKGLAELPHCFFFLDAAPQHDLQFQEKNILRKKFPLRGHLIN